MFPLQQCALQAQQNHLDTESIRHALSPVAQKLRLLIQLGQPENSTLVESMSDNLLTEIKDSVNRLKKALVQDKALVLKEVEESLELLKKKVQDKDPLPKEVKEVEKNFNLLRKALAQDKDPSPKEVKEVEKNLSLLRKALVQDRDPLLEKIEKSLNLLRDMCPLGNLERLQNPEVLTQAPHIYFVLAYLDGFNDNREGAISILKSASERFGDDHSPGILFNINLALALFLYDSEYDPESIFLYLDEALEIAQETGRRIEKLKQRTKNF